jgi:hypothetical protein
VLSFLTQADMVDIFAVAAAVSIFFLFQNFTTALTTQFRCGWSCFYWKLSNITPELDETRAGTVCGWLGKISENVLEMGLLELKPNGISRRSTKSLYKQRFPFLNNFFLKKFAQVYSHSVSVYLAWRFRVTCSLVIGTVIF